MGRGGSGERLKEPLAKEGREEPCEMDGHEAGGKKSIVKGRVERAFSGGEIGSLRRS